MVRAARVARAVWAMHTLSCAVAQVAVLWLTGCAVTSGAAPADVAAVAVDRDAVDQAAVDRAAVDQAAVLASTCAGCHRAGGSAIVDLREYSASRIQQLLLAYKQAPDGPTAMHRMARGYSDAEIAMIAGRLGK